MRARVMEFLSRFLCALPSVSWRECAGGASRSGGMRLVRHSVVDRRASHLFDAAHRVARSWEFPRRTLGVLFFFWAINMFVVWKGIETIKFLEGIGAPFMLIVGLLLLAWITRKAGGFGPVLHTESKFHSTGEFIRFFIPR